MAKTNTGHAGPKHTVLIVTELYPNMSSASYLGSFLVEQLRYLKARNRVVVITTQPVPFTPRHVLLQPSYQFREGVHIYWIPLPLSFIGRFGCTMSPRLRLYLLKIVAGRRIRALARNLHGKFRFDIVHGYETHLGDEAIEIGKQLKIPSVFTLCGIYSYHLKAFGGPIMHLTITRLNSADQLISISNISASSYCLGGVNRKFSVIPFGITIPEAATHQCPPDTVLAFVRSKFVLLTAASFLPAKRIEQSIRTVARLHREGMKDTVLLIVGYGPSEQYVKLAAQEGISDSVLIVGEVPPSEMEAYYRITDVLVHPSVIEGLSMVCLEAMSHGKPVVCTSNIGLVEFLDPGREAVVVPPDDPDALFQATAYLIRNPARRRAIGRRARLRARNLSWPKQVREIEAVYDELGRSR